MSIRDRLRSSSSILSPPDQSKLDVGSSDDARVVTGVTLTCEDVCNEGDLHRDYKLIRGVHRTVDFVRASAVNPSDRIAVAAGGASRATFTSPVMSRRHARITFAEDGSVTVMDVGSMHGTYLGCVDYEDFEPERLKPRRHYTLRSGDTLLLGKPVNRDDRDWKPVVIRVTFAYNGQRLTTPPPNRYGLFLASSDLEDDDAYSVSSSSDEGEHDGRSQRGSSPEVSPAVSHAPLPIGASMSISVSASASRESFVSANRSADGLNSASGVFDLNRTISARSALRAILPPIPRIQSAIRRLPSLRELGFFSSSSSSAAEVNDGKSAMCQDGETPNPAYNAGIEESDSNVLAPIEVDLPNPSQVAASGAAHSESMGIDDGSMFAWQEPSHPQNQLGLELSEQGDLFMSHAGEERKQDVDEVFIAREEPEYMQADENSHVEQSVRVKEVDQDDVKSMDISPRSSRAGTPTPGFRAGDAFDIGQVATGAEVPHPSEPEEAEPHCRCHEQEEQPAAEGMSQDPQQQREGPQQQDAPIPAEAEPVTPQPKRTAYAPTPAITPGCAADLDMDRRRARMARFEAMYGSGAMPSPVSISKDRKRRSGAARVGPTRRSPAPNPPGPFGRVKVVAKHPPDVDVLRARVRTLETRMQELQGSAIMMASVASASASTSASVASVEEARKEMESMREEMRRLSGLLETLVAKIEARANEPVHKESHGVQASSSSQQRSDIEVDIDVDASSQSSSSSRKRKRADDIRTVRASSGTDEGIQSIDRPEVRAVKRARVSGTGAGNGGEGGEERKAVMTAAAAAGYTSLGAALAWVVLAYVV